MSRIVAVIPNICEGLDEKFIKKLEDKLKGIPNLVLLDVSMDQSRNRTVFAFTGAKQAIFEGGMVLYEESLKGIDMRKHQGEYPRIGAVDVFPFVPLKDVSIAETVAMSVEFAEMVGERFKIPVYLFSESARIASRRHIENIRSVQYEGLEERLKDPGWAPDFGTDNFRADAGATIIGARYPLVSFKIFLNTTDLLLTEKICSVISYAKGGLRHVRADSGRTYDQKRTQITVTVSNYRKTPMYQVVEMVRIEGRRFGVSVQEVEMIGLIPERVFLDSAMYYMNVNNFSLNRLVEKNIMDHLNEKMFFMD